jgi:glutaconyl-CoA decarboxylase
MHGETAAVATYARRLVKEKDSGRSLEPVIESMNQLVKLYYDRSRPIYCAQRGFVDEIVFFQDLRRYIVAFAESAYQNPTSICPHNHMMIPRIIKG